MNLRLPLLAWLTAAVLPAQQDIRLPHVFGDRMVLQRDVPLTIWGFGPPGDIVSIGFAGQTPTGSVGDDGRFAITLKPLSASAEPHILVVKGPDNTVLCRDVLVGDVWVLGGQSNMEAALKNVQDGELEMLCADQPSIRLLTIPLRASPVPLDDFPRIDDAPFAERGTPEDREYRDWITEQRLLAERRAANRRAREARAILERDGDK